jgi:hypothetical protein
MDNVLAELLLCPQTSRFYSPALLCLSLSVASDSTVALNSRDVPLTELQRLLPVETPEALDDALLYRSLSRLSPSLVRLPCCLYASLIHAASGQKLSEDGRCVRMTDFSSLPLVQDLDSRTLYLVCLFLASLGEFNEWMISHIV